jgi:MFS family permease
METVNSDVGTGRGKLSAVGLALSLGPLVAALTSVQAGRMADRVGPHCVTVIGLLGIASGSTMLALLPAYLGTSG